MKILYISQYFYPEVGATTNRALANARYLASKGHDITVLTEMPNHPKGVIFDGYRGKLFVKEEFENFKINRVWIYTNQKKNFITRILFYMSFSILATVSSLFNWKKYDIVYVTSPPLFVGIIGINLKFFFPSSRFIFEVRDLWPDAAIEMGELKNKAFRKFSYKLENSLYTKADHIVAVTNRFKSKIIEKGFNENKISVIRNGSDLSFQNKKINPDLQSKHKLQNKFVVIYAGILGIAQNLTTVLRAAQQITDPDIVILLVGAGPEEAKLKKIANEQKIRNVIFTGEISKKHVSDYLSLADCGLIPLKNISVFERTIPSKLFDYMSANLPILLGVKGEAKEILAQSEAGICFKPDDITDLVEKITYMKNNRDELQKMRGKGRKFVEENFDREKLAAKLDDVFTELLDDE